MDGAQGMCIIRRVQHRFGGVWMGHRGCALSGGSNIGLAGCGWGTGGVHYQEGPT